ncbi:hypothetical protein OG819_47490 [Streptomyces sp. NBC_01549]|uniref:hypothetical protein n=1 Tax=unclassified Streptomyces TaxID=2593676 RepID=UPI00224C98B5|nr:hypothetical protein [Streptomyces sp. NBC_01549]MCX4597007.1 hypothetical protein [Streptomyces sp. NBC_01549]
MSLDHGARRSRVILVEPALTQLAKLTADETHRLDRAIVAISVNPELGTEVPGTLLRDYVDEVDGVRVIFYVTALGSGVISGLCGVVAAQSFAAV